MKTATKSINLNWKYKVVSAALTGLAFVGVMCLSDYLFDGALKSLNSYLIQGSLFGIFMGIGLPSMLQKFGPGFTSKLGKNINPELMPDEYVENSGPANLFRGMESVGGKLFLTNKKLVFKSHQLNIQRGQSDIYLENITEVIKRKTGHLIDNGIRIKTNDEKEFDFVLNERDQWLEKINEKIK